METNYKEYLFNYGLHDAIITKIQKDEQGICLFFNEGIYELDANLIEIAKTLPCKINLKINGFKKNNEWEHIEIFHKSKRRFRELNFDDFAKKVSLSGMDIDINFYSSFCNTICIKGYMKDGEYEIIVSEIERIEFVFADQII